MLTMSPELPGADAQSSSGGPGVFLLVHSLVAVAVTALGSVGWYSISPILADASTGETVGIGAVLVAIGAAGKWVADWIVKLRKDRYDDEDKREARRIEQEKVANLYKAQEKAAEIAHLEKALDRETEERRRLQTEIGELRRDSHREMNDLRDQFYKAKVQAGRAITWIRSMEGYMRSQKMDFIPFDADADDDSDDQIRMHGPTPPTGHSP